MFRYAQINGEGHVVSDSHLSGVVEAENLVPVAPDFDLANKRWNGTGWEDCEPEPIPEPVPTQIDRIEEAVMKRNEELRQEGADALTMELLEGGIL